MELQYVSFSHIGQRSKNEDAIYPKTNDKTTNLYMVCDGVGGAARGEVASNLVIESISECISSSNYTKLRSKIIEDAVENAEIKLNSYLEDHPDSSGMATTVTVAYFSDTSALVAHIGDSRIYHFRNGKILFKSTDHSLVSELLRYKHITEEEALNHPRKNEITRAVVAGRKGVKPEIKIIDDIEQGDVFLLCSDGVMESLTDAELIKMVGNNINESANEIVDNCSINSKDNFSGILIKVHKIQKNQATFWQRLLKLKI